MQLLSSFARGTSFGSGLTNRYGMKKLLGFIGATVGGSIGWWLGNFVGFMTAFMLSTIGSGVGIYAAIRIAQQYEV